MSRYTFMHPHLRHHEVAFGFDHALGYFYDVVETTEEGEENMVEEKSSLFNRLTGIQLNIRLKEIMQGNEMLLRRFEKCLDRMALDLDF